MNKLLWTLDLLSTKSLPYAVGTTIMLSAIKVLVEGLTSHHMPYGWLVALSPILLGIFAVGVVNFFSFYLDQD